MTAKNAIKAEQERNELTPQDVLKELRKQKRPLQFFTTKYQASIDDVEYCISELLNQGYLLLEMGDVWSLQKEPKQSSKNIEYISRPDNTYLFGFIGDTHIGSKYCRYDVLDDLYDKFANEGVDRVFHGGNWIEGEARFNKYDIDVYGLDAQCQALADRYPRVGIVTYAVAGDDHEGWVACREGIDIGKHMENVMIESGRSDWENLSYMEAFVGLKNINSHKTTQLSVMHPGGGSAYATCFIEGAEILTKTRGWVPFSELQYSDEVATMTKDNHTFEWQQPSDIIKEHYEGDVYNFKGRSLDFTVTPDHRLWQCDYKGAFKDMWMMRTAESIYNTYLWHQTRLPAACENWHGNDLDRIRLPYYAGKNRITRIGYLKKNNAIRLLAWYISEGHCDKNGVLQISQSNRVNPDNHKEITDLLLNCNLNYAISGEDDSHIRTCSTELCNWLKEQAGHLSYNKKVPLWLKDLPKKDLKLFLDTIVKGDGHNRGTNFKYYTNSQQLRDDIIEISQKCGYGAGYSYITRDNMYVINIRKQNINPTICKKPTKKYYNGLVYCCAVPNELIYVRMNGKCFWSGNSYKPQKIVEAFSGGEKPSILIIGHYHKLSYNHFRNVHCIQAGCTQDQTPFLRKKGIHVDVGGGICQLRQDPKTGVITACRVEFFTYQVKGHYNNRWNKATKVRLPKRSTK